MVTNHIRRIPFNTFIKLLLVQGIKFLVLSLVISFIGFIILLFFNLRGSTEIWSTSIQMFIGITCILALIYLTYIVNQLICWMITGDTFQLSGGILGYFYKQERPATLKSIAIDITFTLIFILSTIIFIAFFGIFSA